MCFTVVVMGTPKTAADEIRERQGRKIRELRKFRRMSQATLAGSLGVTKQSVSEWERGISTPRQYLQVGIAHALDVPWIAIFGLDGERVA